MEDKLSIINNVLSLSGNNEVAEEEDGSEEWRVGSAAYETGVSYLLGQHDWNFATNIVALSRVGTPDDELYTDAYAKPSGALALIAVKVDGYATQFKVVGNQIYTNAASGVTGTVVLQPDPGQMHPLFLHALTCLTKAGIYEGLNEDFTSAQSLRAEAETYIGLARSRMTSEGSSPRPAMRSRMLARRRGRVSGLGR